MELGLKGGMTGVGDMSYNPRRRKLLGDQLHSERDEYYKLMAKDLDSWGTKAGSEIQRRTRWKIVMHASGMNILCWSNKPWRHLQHEI